MTLEIAGRTMFSFGMDRHGAALRDFVMEYGDRLARPHFLDLLLPLSWPSPQDFSRARFRKRWTAFVGMLMAERRAAGKNEGAPPNDLFDLMGAARDPETGEAFTDEQLGDQVATMILAGHETTATALFWSLYLLGARSRHPGSGRGRGAEPPPSTARSISIGSNSPARWSTRPCGFIRRRS